MRIRYPPKLIYHSQFDKHNCIDFHRVHCNEPTPLLLLVFVLDFFEICSGNCECNLLQFCMQIIHWTVPRMSVDRKLQNVTFS